MPLDIKELFNSDLDSNSLNWWSEQKIKKINYNFNLLKNGTPGPVGDKGIDGDPGIKGISGNKGFEGLIGPIGKSGLDAIGIWSHIDLSAQRTLYPSSMDNIDVNLKIGVIGQTQHSNIKQDAVLNIKDSKFTQVGINAEYDSTLKLTSPTSWAKFNSKIIIQLFGIPKLFTIEVDDSTTSAIRLVSESVINLKNNFLISDSNIQILNNFLANTSSDFIIDSETIQFKLNSGCNPGSVLMSVDTDGKVIWANRADAFNSAYPKGSIVKIPLSFFQQQFETEYQITSQEQGTGLIELKWGRGKIGTAYEGWYLCHGKTWFNNDFSYSTPNLNKFDYLVDENGIGQTYSQTEIDYFTPLIAGYDIRMDIVTDDFSLYNASNIGQLDIKLDFTGVDYDAVKMVHIVYLDENDLVWNTTPEIPRGDFIKLGNNSINSSNACADSNRIEFELVPGLGAGFQKTVVEYWNDLTSDFLNKILYNVDNYRQRLDVASTGWYSTGEIARYWDASLLQFTLSTECATSTNIYMQSCVDDLNDISGLTPSIYNLFTKTGNSTSDLQEANVIKNEDGTFAAEGWYYQTNETDIFIRRYWDGNQFVGKTFTQQYIYRVKNLKPGGSTLDFLYYYSSPSGTGCDGCCSLSINPLPDGFPRIATYIESESELTITDLYLSDLVGKKIYTIYDYNFEENIPPAKACNALIEFTDVPQFSGASNVWIYDDQRVVFSITLDNIFFARVVASEVSYTSQCNICDCSQIE